MQVEKTFYFYLNLFIQGYTGQESDFNRVCSKMALKTLGQVLKIRVGRVIGNADILFLFVCFTCNLHIHGFCSKLSNQIYCSLLLSIHDLGLFDLDIKGVFAFLDQTTMTMINIHVSRCNFFLIFIFQYVIKRIGGVMVSVLASRFESQQGQTKVCFLLFLRQARSIKEEYEQRLVGSESE